MNGFEDASAPEYTSIYRFMEVSLNAKKANEEAPSWSFVALL